eukprot:2021363-Prymnesium_polylepis.1
MQNEGVRASRQSLKRSTSSLYPFGVRPVGPTGIPAPPMRAPPQPPPQTRAAPRRPPPERP